MIRNNLLFFLLFVSAICWGETAYDNTFIGYKKSRRYRPLVSAITRIAIMPVKKSDVNASLDLLNLVARSDTGEIWLNQTLQKVVTYMEDKCITRNISIAPSELADSIKTSNKKRYLFLEDFVYYASPTISQPIVIDNEMPDFVIFFRDFSIKTDKNPWTKGLEDFVKVRLLVLSAIITIWDNRLLKDAWVGRIVADEVIRIDNNGNLIPKESELDDLLKRFAELFFLDTDFEE